MDGIQRFLMATVAGFAGSACAAPATERVPVSPTDRSATQPAPPAWQAPPPAPQAMVAPPTAMAVPERAVLQTMTESERTEAFRTWVGPRRQYTPPAPPLPPPPRVEREVRYVTTSHVHDYGCRPGCSLGRLAVYTGVGAIIGHQYHHRGRGAAIGAGLALLSSPWWWGGGCWWDD